MSRFFSFGCSFTQYIWPTWADIIGRQFDHFENWGRPGSGNYFIFNSLIECNVVNNITSNDVVGIVWSMVGRYDTYKDGCWQLNGNQPASSKLWSDYDIRGLYLRDLSFMYAAKQLLDQIGCKYFFSSASKIKDYDHELLFDQRSYINDILDYYDPVLLNMFRPSMSDILFDKDWNPRIPVNSKELDPIRKKYQQVAGPDWPTFNDFWTKNIDHVPNEIKLEIQDEKKWQWRTYIARTARDDPHPTAVECLEYIDQALPEFSADNATRVWCSQIEEKRLLGQDFSDLWLPNRKTRW
jgi:hypothetical protein